jgi:hypothetical protein
VLIFNDKRQNLIRKFNAFEDLKFDIAFTFLRSDCMTETTEEKTTKQTTEKLPLWESYKVIDYVTIFKSNKWWEAIVAIESFGSRSIAMYMWEFRDGRWKRKHKFSIKNVDEWNKVKNSVEQLLPKLTKEK